MSTPSAGREVGFYRVIDHGNLLEVEIRCSKLQEELCGLLIAEASEQRWSRLLLNCSNIHFITSLGLGGLIRLDRALRPGGGRLRLCGLRPDLRELFVITRIDRVVQLCDDRESALTLAW